MFPQMFGERQYRSCYSILYRKLRVTLSDARRLAIRIVTLKSRETFQIVG